LIIVPGGDKPRQSRPDCGSDLLTFASPVAKSVTDQQFDGDCRPLTRGELEKFGISFKIEAHRKILLQAYA